MGEQEGEAPPPPAAAADGAAALEEAREAAEPPPPPPPPLPPRVACADFVAQLQADPVLAHWWLREVGA